MEKPPPPRATIWGVLTPMALLLALGRWPARAPPSAAAQLGPQDRPPAAAALSTDVGDFSARAGQRPHTNVVRAGPRANVAPTVSGHVHSGDPASGSHQALRLDRGGGRSSPRGAGGRVLRPARP